jgi:transposase
VRTARRSLVALAAAALLAACGSYTKADFSASANAICAGAVRATRALMPPSFASGSTQQLHALAAYVSRVVPIVRSEARQLRALKRPAGKPRALAALERYLRALPQAVAEYVALAAAARSANPQRVASAEAALRASPLSALAGAYGLRSCASPGATVS